MLTGLKRFFIWLAGQPGYKSRISYADAEYFNLSVKEIRIAKAHRDARVPTLEQIRHVIRTMPAGTPNGGRGPGPIAFDLPTPAPDRRVGALQHKPHPVCEAPPDQQPRGAR